MNPHEIVERTCGVAGACCVCGGEGLYTFPVLMAGGFGRLHLCEDHPPEQFSDRVQEIAHEMQREALREYNRETTRIYESLRYGGKPTTFLRDAFAKAKRKMERRKRWRGILRRVGL